MKSEEEIRERIKQLNSELKTLEAIAEKGFSFPTDRIVNHDNRKVRKALIVGLKWVLKE